MDVSSVHSLILGTIIRDLCNTGNVSTESITVLATRDQFKLLLKTLRHFSSSERRGIIFHMGAAIEYSYSSDSVEIDITAPEKEMGSCITLFDTFKKVGSTLEWVYSTDGESVTLPISEDKYPIAAFYPFLTGTLEDYYDDYMESDASILLLIGPPGTAKTSFVKGLLQHTQGKGLVSYDPAILNKDYLFANFIGGDQTFLILEDADAFLQTRESGNTMMHRFLNVGDGLVSTKGKKLIFTTNLPTIEDIDPALVRPGRCFDVLQFGALTGTQADTVRKEFNIKQTGKKGTVAEIMNEREAPTMKTRNKVGFI